MITELGGLGGKFSRKNYGTIFESTTGKPIQKPNSPLTNCRSLVVKDERSFVITLLKWLLMLYANTYATGTLTPSKLPDTMLNRIALSI